MDDILQFVGILGLAGLSFYAFSLSKGKYSRTFNLSGPSAFRSLAILAGILAISRLLVFTEVLSRGAYFNFSGLLLLGLMAWLLISARTDE